MNIVEKLIAVQSELKAPKNQRNNFGKYNYRSQEDILEAVKTLLAKHQVTFFITDETKETASGLFYTESKVIFIDAEDPNSRLEAKAQAFIDLNAKGMSAGQASGSASSYARKYALNGLFLIDDTKDSDATNTHDRSVTAKSSGLPKLTENMPAFEKAKTYITNGGNIATIEQKYSVTDEIKKLLLA